VVDPEIAADERDLRTQADGREVLVQRPEPVNLTDSRAEIASRPMDLGCSADLSSRTIEDAL